MAVYKDTIKVQSHGKTPTYIDVTPEVKRVIEESGIKSGLCAVISPHTTCSVFFEEFVHDYNENGDEFLQEDLNNALAKIIPDHVSADQYHYPGEEHYKEDAHLRSTILGSSEIFDVEDGKLGVGVTGYVYFVDFDRTRPRERKCKIVVIGE